MPDCPEEGEEYGYEADDFHAAENIHPHASVSLMGPGVFQCFERRFFVGDVALFQIIIAFTGHLIHVKQLASLMGVCGPVNSAIVRPESQSPNVFLAVASESQKVNGPFRV